MPSLARRSPFGHRPHRWKEFQVHRKQLPLVSFIGVCLFVLSLTGVTQAMVQTQSASPAAETGPTSSDSGPLVYNQITNSTEGSGYVGIPKLSADGTTAVFTDAPGTGAVET